MDSTGGGANSKGDVESSGNHHDSSPSRHHDHQNYFRVLKIVLPLFVVLGLSYLVLNQSDYPSQLFLRNYTFSQGNLSSESCKTIQENATATSNDTTANILSNRNDDNKLRNILQKAAMKDNKTVIITALNAAWTEPNSIFDLFLESFRIGNETQDLINHVVVVAFDQTAYSRCLAVHPHCFALTTEGIDFSGEERFMSEDYLKMMWRRIDFLRIVLELGYDFVFSDADVMWLRDPFLRFLPDGDFQIACDHYYGDPTDLSNSPNGGFNYVKSNNRTIEFYNFWYNGRNYFPGKHDQDVLNYIKMDPYVLDIGVKMRFLDTVYFGGFCEPREDLDLVITMHANCCIGLELKIHDITVVIEDWKKYMALPNIGKRNLTWTVPRLCY